jgi:excisionase family DNA binding protein
MLTVKQAAARASVSASLIYELCAAGLLLHMRLGRPGRRGVIRIAEADLDAFLASRKTGEPACAPAPKQRVFKHVILPK